MPRSGGGWRNLRRYVEPNKHFPEQQQILHHPSMLYSLIIVIILIKVSKVLEADGGGSYFTWNRWGRVGEKGMNKLEPHGSNKQKAISSFEKKFKVKLLLLVLL